MPLMIDTLELFEEAPRRAAMREGAMVGGSVLRRVQALVVCGCIPTFSKRMVYIRRVLKYCRQYWASRI